MNPIVRCATLAMVALLVTACGGEDPPSEPVAPPPDAVPAPPPLPAPEPEKVTAETPEAETPAPAPAAPPVVPSADETGIGAGTPSVTGFHGFGPARFGDDEESVRIAWGRPMAFDRVASADAPCAYLVPDPAPSDGMEVAFMFENGKFVRYDVKGAQYQAPGSGMIGNNLEALKALYEGRYTEQPHKYIEGGKTLVVTSPEGGDSALVFDIGADGMATSWRVGVPPQIHYVEGCG
jgi:hypothetical protein